jgi:hypothetical protein
VLKGTSTLQAHYSAGVCCDATVTAGATATTTTAHAAAIVVAGLLLNKLTTILPSATATNAAIRCLTYSHRVQLRCAAKPVAAAVAFTAPLLST